MNHKRTQYKADAINLTAQSMRRMTQGLCWVFCFYLVTSLSCTRVHHYVPISGGQIVTMRPAGLAIDALQKENDRIRIQIAGALSHKDEPRFVLEIENKTNQELTFGTKQVTGKLVEKDILLPVVHCYKPREAIFIIDSSDFEIPCENQIKAGQRQRRFIYLAQLPESFRQYGQPIPPHHIQLTTDAKSGIEINFLFKLGKN